MDRKDVVVENKLLQIEDNLITPNNRDCVIEIVVQDVGAWFVKFREIGVIVNRRNLILSNSVQVDATLSFNAFDAFVDMSTSDCSMEQLQQQGRLEVFQADPSFTAGLGNIFKTLTDRDESVLFSARKIRQNTLGNLGKPIKAGWCYKKRDIIMGWRCRYFKIFQGQVEYFRDEKDVMPRGVIPILGAEIKGPVKCTINGNHECFSISIEPRHKDKIFKLASIKVGNEGMEDILSWINVLVKAAKPIDSGPEAMSDAGDEHPPSAVDGNTSPRITRSSGTIAVMNSPPPLITGTGTAARAGTIIKRSILGSVVSAVRRRGSGNASGAPMPSWTSSGPTQTGTSRRIMTTAPGSDISPYYEQDHSIATISNLIHDETNSRDAVKSELLDDVGSGWRHADTLKRMEIFGVCVGAMAVGWWWSGLYGVMATAFVCILIVVIAFVPLSFE